MSLVEPKPSKGKIGPYQACIVVAGQVVELLMKRQKTLATAESCTGGLLSSAITEIAGSSRIFVGGACTYSVPAKCEILDIPLALVENRGVVSQEVALAMAKGIRSKLGADFGLATTGVAGPGGGTAEVPVGAVWCGLASRNEERAFLLHLRGTRQEVRFAATERALMELEKFIFDSDPGRSSSLCSSSLG